MDNKFPFNHFLNFNETSLSSGQMELNYQGHFLNPEIPAKEKDPIPMAAKKPITREIKTPHLSKKEGEKISPLPTKPGEIKDLRPYQNQILTLLKDFMPPQKYDAYFSNGLSLEQVHEDEVVFRVTTNFIKTMIENHYLSHIQEALVSVFGKSYRIVILTASGHDSKLEEIPFSPGELEDLEKKGPPLPLMKNARFHLDLIPSKEDLLNQVDSTVINHMESHFQGHLIDHKKTFDNFIVGPSNNMAYASTLAVTRNPGKVYPSLYLHSNSGLGKTHLLNAVANKLREVYPHLKVYLTTARDFMTEMVDAMAHKRVHEFRKKYSEHVDVLMIDDVHELKNKTGTQNEFFHIFNELYNKGKQLIFTSDKPPKVIDGLEERIKTRLSWGLVLDIQEPDIETRIAILKKKVMDEDLFLSEDVVNLIATSVKGNIRELEGSLIRLGAYASVMRVDIDTEIAKEQLKISDQNLPPRIDMEAVAKVVSQWFKIPVADIRSKVRLRDVTKARHVAMYLSYKVVQETLTQIGLFFGGRDHTSVLHAIEKIKAEMQSDPDFMQSITEMEANFKH